MPEPLLVAAPSAWRDACFSLPATRALAAVAEVTLLCEPRQAAFWRAANCGEVIAGDDFSKIIPKLPRALLWEDGAAAKACARAAIPHRTGLPAAGLAKRLTHPLERTVRPGPPEHRVQRYLETAALLGAEPHDARWFEPLAGEEEPGIALIAPDSDFGRHHEWPLARWLELLESIGPDPARVRLAGGPLADQLAAKLGLEVVALESPVEARRFGWVIGADASLPHVAGAFGTTCAVLYGPGDPDLVRPLGKRHAVVRRKVECSPCFADRCLLDGRCQAELEVETVRRALTDFLRS